MAASILHRCKRLPRRHVLIASAAAAANMALAPLPSAGASLTKLRDLFKHPESARRVGNRVLSALPSLDVEMERINRSDIAEPVSRLRARVSAEIRADFTADRVVVVNGWLFAETEARVCALLAGADT